MVLPVLSLGGRIRELRTARGITQRELAEPRYSRSFLAAVESGHRIPNEDALSYLAGRLDVDPDDLRHGRPPGAADDLADELSVARQRLSQGQPEQAAAMAASVAERALRYGLAETAGRALNIQGDAVLQKDGPEAAQPILARGLEISPGGLVGVRLASKFGQCLFLTGQTMQSVAYAESALFALRAAPPVDPTSELVLLGSLIYPYVEVGAVERARRVVDEGLALLPRVPEATAIADFYAVATQLWHAEGKLSEVDIALNTAREIYARLGWEREIGRCHWTRGYVLVRMDRLDEASDELILARKILGPVGARHFYAGATSELAEVRRKQGRLDEAEALCHEAIEYVNAAGYDEGIAETDRLLGRIAIARGDLDRAEELLNRAAERYSGAGLNNELMRTCRELGELLRGQQRLDEALAVLQRGIACV